MTQIREKTTIVSSELGENSRLMGYATTGTGQFLNNYIKQAKTSRLKQMA